MAVEIHVGSGFCGRLLTIVEKVHFAVGTSEEHEAASADVARLGIDNLQREADGDSRVHRVAALLQDRNAGLRGLRVHRGHHRFGRMRGMHDVAGDGWRTQHEVSTSGKNLRTIS